MTNPRRRVPALPTPAADDGPWRRVKAAAAERHGEGPIAMWLAPVVYLGMDGDVMLLGAPSNMIRDQALALLTIPEAGGPSPGMKYDIAISPGFALMKEALGHDRTRS